MKRIFLFLAPIFLGLLVFFTFLFFLSKNNSGTGALQITAVPVSNVYINGLLVGKTPLCRCEGKDMLATGSYQIKLVPLAGSNLSPYQDSVTITKGTLTVVDRTFGDGEFSSGSIIGLVPLQSSSQIELFVTSFPSNATVLLDNNPVGSSPVLLKNITESDHDILIKKTGYKDKTVHIHTVQGYELSAIITLGLASQNATQEANFQNATLTPVAKTKVTILQTPTGFLRVRSEPSIAASETAQVNPGDTFDYVDEQDGWYEIQVSPNQTGWVSSQYASKQ